MARKTRNVTASTDGVDILTPGADMSVVTVPRATGDVSSARADAVQPVSPVPSEFDKLVAPKYSEAASMDPVEILKCEVGTRGAIEVSFSALDGDVPEFYFENSIGNIFPVRPAAIELSSLVGVNLLATLDGVDLDWQFTNVTSGVNFGKNVSPLWTMLDADTFYVSAGRRLEPTEPDPRITLSDPLLGGATPVRPNKEYSFCIFMAVHRCTARLEIECLSAEGEILFTESKRVDTNFLGGRHQEDYDRVEVDFVTPPDAVSVRVSVVKGPSTQVDDGFVFFAKPSLAERPVNGTPRFVSQSMLTLLKLNPNLQIFNAAVPVPRQLCVEQSDPVTLYVLVGAKGRRVEGLEVSWDAPIQIDLCWLENRDLLFRGARPYDDFDALKVGVFVDGELSVESEISETGAFEGRLTLAARHLDGRPHAIEMRLLPGQFSLSRTFGILPFYLTPWEALQEYAKGPFNLSASPAAVHHYRSYRAWAENGKTRELPALTALNDELLQGFKKRTDYPKLAFPKVEKPKVSIVIPVHNKFEVTYFCLCSLLFAYNDASYEVIIADDGSTDTTVGMQKIVSGVTIVRHDTALGFVDSCNDGASIARGEYVFFLNNDTEVTAGFLDELIKVFDNFDNVGLVGSKLLYPDGKLQEAGGIVWRTGNPWNVGRNGNAADPQFCYLRQADYISGAAIMLSRALWEEVGGFSQEMAPAYFEDADLAMKVRATGRFVVYVPNSVVFHFEGQSAGTSTASGMKRFQEVNRPKFKRKWPKIYSRHGEEGVRPDLEKDRNIAIRVLMLDHAFPHVDSDAGSYAAFQEIRLLQSIGAKITFIPRNLAWMDRHTLALENIGVECLYAPFVMSIENYLRDHAADYDLVYITRFRIADEFAPLIRRHAPAAKIVLNLADLHFLRELREASAGTENYTFDRALETRAAELKTISSVDLTLTYSDVESTVIQSHLADAAKVAKVPWVVDVTDAPRPKFAETKDILFLGGFAHDPNKEAVKFFARTVMPRLREKLPNVRFRVAGSRPPQDVLALESDSVEIMGFVRDLDALFDSARVYVAPLLAGAGIKGKVVEGMARGIPTVLSPVAAEGTGLASGYDCFIAKTVDEWVDGIVKLYTDEALWKSVGDAAKEGARARFSFEAGQELMRDALGMVDIFTPSTGLFYKWARP